MNESIESILAEMRREVGDGEDTYCGKRIIRRMDDVRVRQYCNRVEAAWKREREELERYAASKMLDGATIVDNRKVGNGAAMREALEFVAHLDDDSYTSYDIAVAVQKANAALSTPARNCDRYKDAPSAYADFIVPWKLDGHLDDVPTLQDFADWLFAPAAERKGEGDGR